MGEHSPWKRGQMRVPKKTGRWIVIAVAGAVLYFFLAGEEGLVNIYLSHRKVLRIEEEIDRLRNAIDSLKTEIRKLDSDTAHIERVAREKLGMAREDERVYRFVE